MGKLDDVLDKAAQHIADHPNANIIFSTEDGYSKDELDEIARKARARGYKVRVNATGDTVIVNDL